tara:strand:+ start:2598 stop:3377 length:780 start_codon:yes stop_codon:yes gene_type:complete
MFICIAGKNECAINAAKILIKSKFKKKQIIILPNKSDNGFDNWQPSLKKFARLNKFKIASIDDLYKIKNLIFFSLEYEKIIDINKFKSKNLFNFHFSLLPKYRGCHTNFLQIYNGEKYSGVTLHKINSGIDTGDIVDQIKFKIKLNDTAYDNYLKLMRYSITLFKKNLNKILNFNYNLKKQKLSKGSYYSRESVNYKKIIKFSIKKPSLKLHNKIRSLIFSPYQIPIVNGVKVKKSLYKRNKIYLIESSNNRFKKYKIC